MSFAPDRVALPDASALARLPRRRLAALRTAGRDLVAELEDFASKGGHPVADLSRLVGGRFVETERYPAESVADEATGFSWFYHAHPGWTDRPWDEHGHFHCFVDTVRLPRPSSPLAIPPEADPSQIGCTHLVGVSIDSRGVPMTVFAPNRWVTDEWMYPGPEVAALAARYRLGAGGEFAAASRWLSALVRLLQPAIAALLEARDARLQVHRAIVGPHFGEDHSLEIAAHAEIDLDAWMDAVDLAWAARPR